MKLRHALPLFLLSFALAAVLTLPAVHLTSRLDPQGPLRFHGVEGSVRQGQSSGGIVLNGRPFLDVLEWELKPWRLLMLRVAADVSGRASSGRFTGRLELQRDGTVSLQGLDAELDVRTLAQTAGQSYVPVEGSARLEFSTLSIRDGVPLDAAGQIRLRNLRWTLARTPLLLGDFEVRVQSADPGLQLQLSSVSGPIELRGEARLPGEKRYELDLQIRPRAEADAALVSLIRSLGPADSQAWYRLKRSGQW